MRRGKQFISETMIEVYVQYTFTASMFDDRSHLVQSNPHCTPCARAHLVTKHHSIIMNQ